MTLNEVRINQRVKVTKINGEGALKRRIMDMGITKGCSVLLKNVAPFLDPIDLVVRGYNLSIRNQEAKMIEVEVINDENSLSR